MRNRRNKHRLKSADIQRTDTIQMVSECKENNSLYDLKTTGDSLELYVFGTFEVILFMLFYKYYVYNI